MGWLIEELDEFLRELGKLGWVCPDSVEKGGTRQIKGKLNESDRNIAIMCLMETRRVVG